MRNLPRLQDAAAVEAPENQKGPLVVDGEAKDGVAEGLGCEGLGCVGGELGVGAFVRVNCWSGVCRQ